MGKERKLVYGLHYCPWLYDKALLSHRGKLLTSLTFAICFDVETIFSSHSGVDGERGKEGRGSLICRAISLNGASFGFVVPCYSWGGGKQVIFRERVSFCSPDVRTVVFLQQE